MLGSTGTLRQGGAQAGSDKEYMETGEHMFRFVNENLVGHGSLYRAKRGMDSQRLCESFWSTCIVQHFTFAIALSKKAITRYQVLTRIDSSPIEKDKICKPASACFTMKAPLPLHRNKRNERRMASFIFKKVSRKF